MIKINTNNLSTTPVYEATLELTYLDLRFFYGSGNSSIIFSKFALEIELSVNRVSNDFNDFAKLASTDA